MVGSISPNFWHLHLNEYRVVFLRYFSLLLRRELRVMQSTKLGQMSLISGVKAGCQYRLLFVGCICWRMLIQCDKGKKRFWHLLEK